MKSTIISTTADSISSGGSISGDLTIEGDLTVDGGGGFAYSEVLTGDMSINGPEGTGAASAGLLVLSTAEETVRVGTVDQLGRIDFQAPSETGGSDAILVGASIFAEAEEDFSSTNNSTGLVFSTATTSAPIERMRIDQDGNIGIGTAAPATLLHLKSSTSNEPVLKIENNNDDQHPPRIQFLKDVSDGAESDGDLLGHIQFKGQDDGDALHTFASIYGISDDVTAGTEDGQLRFEVTKAGTDANIVLSLDANSRISLSNNDSGDGNTVFGYLAGNALGADTDNCVFIGENAGLLLAGHNAGAGNIAVGKDCFDAADGTEMGNVAIGHLCMGSVDEGASGDADFNVALGYNALRGGAFSGADALIGNIAIGSYAMDATDTNAQTGTVAIGYSALSDLTSGAGNIAIGYQSLDATDDGNYNTAVGYGSLSANCSDSNTAIGWSSLAVSVGTQNTAVGKSSSLALTSGANNVALGHHSLLDIVDGSQNVAIGSFALGGALGATADGSANNVVIGYSAGSGNWADQDCSNLVAIGSGAMAGALAGDTADGSVAVGKDALAALTSGAGNTAVGYQAMLAHTTGSRNIAIGHGAMNGTGEDSAPASDDNIFIGYDAGGGDWDDDADGTSASGQNVAIGNYAMDAAMDGANYNTAIGHGSLGSITTGGYNVGMGKDAGAVITIGVYNTAIGARALSAETIGDRSTAVGYQSLFLQVSDSSNDQARNTGVGMYASHYNVLGQNNTSLGYAAGMGVSTKSHSNCTFLGSYAGTTAYTGNNNIAIGAYAMDDTDADATVGASTENVFIGNHAGGGTWVTAASNYNVAIGNNSMDDAMNGALYNTAVGYAALSTVTEGDNNTAVGNSALFTVADGVYNTSIGAYAGYYIAGGDSNTCLGYAAGDVITTGSNNVYVGYNADGSANDVTNEIVIAATSSALVGAGTETCRIGVSSDYISVDFGENATWAHSSDVRIKKEIKDNGLGLDFINDLRTVTFKKKAPSEYPEEFEQYDSSKTERKNPDKIHYGFIAQEVKESMDRAGHSEFTVWQEDRDGMQELGELEFITPLIKAVQELSAEVESLKEQLNK